MTTLREAAQQALEALLDDPNKLVQISENHWESKRDLAVIALRAALAEPEELRENERIKAENERLREVLNKLEYFSDGTIRRYPTESDVEAALVAAEKDKEIKRLQDMLYEQLGELTALRAEKQMRERIKEIKEQPK